MSELVQEFKNNRIKAFFVVLLAGCAFCQLLLTAYFTMFEGMEHMGIDSSWEYLKAIVSANEGKIFAASFLNGTTHPEFERLILIVPFYKLFGNIYVAYGLSNLIVTALCLGVLVKIAGSLNLQLTQTFILINLFLCPYLANGYSVKNELGYFEVTTGFAAYYNIAMLAILLVFYFVVNKFEKHQMTLALLIDALLIYVCICKGLGMLIWLGAPILVYLLCRMFISNDIKVLTEKKSLWMLSFVASIFIGRIAGGILGFQYFDSDMNWAGAAKYLHNLGNIIVGFALMLGGLPERGIVRSADSFMGFVYFFGIVISLVFYVAVIYWLVKTIKVIRSKEELNQGVLFLLIVILVNVFAFSLLEPYTISETYQIRYLTPAALAGFVLVVLFIKDLDEELLLRRFGVAALFISVVCMNLYSDYFLAIVDNSSLKVSELLEVIDDTDAGLVYFWDSGKTLVEPERIIRVVDQNRVYKCVSYENELENFGDYKYYDDSKEYSGPTALVQMTDAPAASEVIMESYELIAQVGEYSVFYSKDNPIDLKSIVVNWK